MKRFFAVFCAITASARAGTIAPFVLSLPGGGAISGTTLASGLDYPFGMTALNDGSIVFGVNSPTTPFGFAAGPSNGSVWVLPKQANGAFGAPVEALSGLAGPVTNIRSTPGLILVDAGGASSRTMNFYDQNFSPLGTVSFSYPTASWWHSTGMSLIAPQPDGSDRIYFIVGSEADQAKTTDQVTTSGLFSATLNADSVYMVSVKDSGGTLTVSSPPTQIATGLRNAYGLTLDSAGNLIIGDNGQDGAHSPNQFSADTLHMIAPADIGTAVFDFGFPDSYVDFTTGDYINGDPSAVPPLAAFLPVADSQGSLQYAEGLAGMAFLAPGALSFVGALGGEIVGFDGVSPAGGAANFDNALLYYDFASGKYYPLVDDAQSGVGHLNTVFVEGNTLFLADTSTEGDLGGAAGDYSGAIYEFPLATPEPATFWTLVCLAAVLGLIRTTVRPGVARKRIL